MLASGEHLYFVFLVLQIIFTKTFTNVEHCHDSLPVLQNFFITLPQDCRTTSQHSSRSAEHLHCSPSIAEHLHNTFPLLENIVTAFCQCYRTFSGHCPTASEHLHYAFSVLQKILTTLSKSCRISSEHSSTASDLHCTLPFYTFSVYLSVMNRERIVRPPVPVVHHCCGRLEARMKIYHQSQKYNYMNL